MGGMDGGWEAAEKALEALLVNNRELERLENIADRFNAFEALGIVNRENSHSDFLSFLLDPKANHGLSDQFARRFLQAALLAPGEATPPLSPLEIDLLDLSGAEVVRERDRIDILLLDEDNDLAIIVENKIWSAEHSGQLGRYYQTVKEKHQDLRVMGIYLTPQGQPPSHPAYLAVGYSVVCDVLERLLESRRSSMDLGLAVLLEHYNQVLRRRVVGESEIVELCRQIYRKHKTALDLIYEHRPDRQNEIVSLLERLVTEQEGLQLDDVSKTKIKFAVTDWDTRAMVSGGGWASSRRVMLFEFWNYPGSLDLKLLVGPSPDNVRRRLLEMAGAGAPLKAPRKSTAVYSTIYSRKWARGNRLEEGDIEDVESKLRRSWEDFLKSDLPRIHSLLRAEGWFWQE